MRRLVAAAFCGVLAFGAASSATTAMAQDSAKTELEVKFEEKISKPWFTQNGFTADYDVALAKAKETGKPIFAYFTRSFAT